MIRCFLVVEVFLVVLPAFVGLVGLMALLGFPLTALPFVLSDFGSVSSSLSSSSSSSSLSPSFDGLRPPLPLFGGPKDVKFRKVLKCL